MFYCEHFVTRKLGLHQNALFVISFPGGYGTLDEIFEVWHRDKNLVLYNTEFYKDIIDEIFNGWKKVGIEEKEKLKIFDNVEEIIDYINSAKDKVKVYKNTEEEVKRANEELEEGLKKLEKLPPAVVIVGSPKEGSKELKKSRRIYRKIVN